MAGNNTNSVSNSFANTNQIELSEITFIKLYNQLVYKLQTLYNKSGTSFTLASPLGNILTGMTDMFGLNMLYNQNVRRQFDLNDPLNQDITTIRSISRIGQYNPMRAACATGVLSLRLKAGVDVTTEIPGSKIVFQNRQQLKNNVNNLDYILDLNQSSLTFTLSNQTPILLSILQGYWASTTFTGDGTDNQTFSVVPPNGVDLDNFRVNVYVNGNLWTPVKHKFDMLLAQQAYVAYTGLAGGGVDIIFGNGDEGMQPPFGSIIFVEYVLTNGKDGNVVDPALNDFQFIDMPTDYYGNQVDVSTYFDVGVDTNITFGTDGDTPDYLKKILPYASSNFVLAGSDQYKFFLMRLGLFSIIDVYSTRRSDSTLLSQIYALAKTNTDLLNKISNDDSQSTLRQLVNSNLTICQNLLKTYLAEGGDNTINVFLIPDIRIFYGSDQQLNYFNIDESAFILDTDEQNRVLNYLTTQGIQTILNEVVIQPPVIKRYAVNVTLRLFDDAITDNINNEIIDAVSDYFVALNRRDRIPPSDLIRIIDGIYGIDSVTVTYVSELNENYYKEYLVKAQAFQLKNGRQPLNTEINMSTGTTYDPTTIIGLDPILGDIIIDKTDLPIIRGGFYDRYNNYYNAQPGQGAYSAVNILVLPTMTPRKNVNAAGNSTS